METDFVSFSGLLMSIGIIMLSISIFLSIFMAAFIVAATFVDMPWSLMGGMVLSSLVYVTIAFAVNLLA